MGVGEWFLARGLPYGSLDIMPWFGRYKVASTKAARYYSHLWNFPEPIAVRAIAPTGTISIVAGTSSGVEPLFAPAYERRYLTPTGFQTDILLDPVAKKLHEAGIPIIDYAHIIEPDRRVRFQAEVQTFVDNGISSTVNLPDSNTNPETFGAMLMKYLPRLRGITAFPNGSRGLQPITPVDFGYAASRAYQLGEYDPACPEGICSI